MGVESTTTRIVPQKSYFVDNQTTTTLNNTYFTLLDLSGVRGRLGKVKLHSSSSSFNSSNLRIRVTIDGVEQSYEPDVVNAYVYSPNDISNCIEYIYAIEFYNSIRVEYMKDGFAISTTLTCTAEYQLE